jgi:hypothetical protein
MPTRLRTLAIAALMFGTVPAFGQTVPKLNVEPTCRNLPADAMGLATHPSICLKSENEARDKLTHDWSSFPVADRGLCTQTATMGGTASYVELLTCLEMRRDARALPQDALTMKK